MDYAKGTKSKPKEIQRDGKVIFTDGTYDHHGTQELARVYGFKYNRQDGCCYAHEWSPMLSNFQNRREKNTGIGNKNKIRAGVFNSLTTGKYNEAKGQNENIIIAGEDNKIDNNINNAVVLGSNAHCTREGEFVIGGGYVYESERAIQQMSIIQMSASTTDATQTSMTIMGRTMGVEDDAVSLDTSREPYIFFRNNMLVTFECFVNVICTGGSSGTVGHYKSLKHTGSIIIDNGYNPTFTQSSTTIGSNGTTGTVTMAVVLDPQMSLKVTGAANINLQWTATVYWYENKLGASITF